MPITSRFWLYCFDTLFPWYGSTINDYQKMCAVAAIIISDQIKAEDPATANHTERLALANSIPAAPWDFGKQIAWAILGSSDIKGYTLPFTDDGITHLDILNAANAVVDVLILP